MSFNSALLTDFYQLTMAYGYWRVGLAEREAVFHLVFRKHPFQGNYVISCGLASVIDYIQQWHFTSTELSYLQTLLDAQGHRLFSNEFLDYLAQLRFSGDLQAMPEGQVMFANEPILRIKAPILQCQLLETALMNRLSFASLVATKASRVCQAAQGDAVIEFGLRRAQGPDGGMTASRAAFIGGCESVSNTLAAMQYQIPARGTMAHSWVMAFADELTAFENFAQVMSGNAVLLVDTYDTCQGVQNAITVGRQLRAKGSELLGIRLDSGDLNALSHQARQLLNQAGFKKTKIMASGDLDEYKITALKQQRAPIDIWGVGTRMTTAYDQPALDAAYKLSALADAQGHWQYKIKRSNSPEKTTTPGVLQVRRFMRQGQWITDIIFDLQCGMAPEILADADQQQDLLTPIFRQGRLVYSLPSIQESQSFCRQQLREFLQSDIQEFPVRLESRLQALKDNLLAKYSHG